MCKLHMKESVEPPGVETHDNKIEMKETSQAEQSFGNSASLEHMLNDEQQATGRDCDGHTSKEQKSDGLNDKQQLEEQIGNAENTPPHKFHAMFVGLQNMGKSDSESIIDKSSSYIDNNSIQCGQRPHTGYNKLISATNLETMLSTCNTHQCLSSETRIQSYGNSEANVGLDNMTLDDFEVNDGVPSVSFMES